ncbi:MAG: diguanylate cyclase [Sedimenticola sp.]|nr:diguanylate cyclase [Sedimenticola sp.]
MNQASSFTDYLQASPCGVLILDQAGTIRWLNPALEAMLELSAEQLLGTREEGFPFATQRSLFKGPGLHQLVGPGISRERWLLCSEAQPESADPEAHTIRYFQDLTEQVRLQEENQRLQQQVEELAITDELTGLANRQALTRALNTQVARSRRYQNPLSVAVVTLLQPGKTGQIADEVILAVSQYLRDRLRWVDVIARWEHNQFIIILPETTLQDASDLMEKMLSTFSEMVLPEQYTGVDLQLQYGLAEWHKGQDARLLLKEAFNHLAGSDSRTVSS